MHTDTSTPASQQPQPASTAPQVRSRVTVVCAECKRLKLKCDRRTPCGSCVKRDTVVRCEYSPAAAEKVDLHSLNNRVLALESHASRSSASSADPFIQPFPPPGSSSVQNNPGHPSSSSVSAFPSANGNAQPKALLATGAGYDSSSIAINMQDITALYINGLGIKHSLLTPLQSLAASSSNGKVKLEENQLESGDIAEDASGMYQPDPPPFSDPLMPPQDQSEYTSSAQLVLTPPSTQVSPSLVVQLPPLSALDSIEEVIRMHVFMNWRNFCARVATILDVAKQDDSIYFGSSCSTSSDSIPRPLSKNTSSSSTNRASTTNSRGNADYHPPTLGMFAAAAAAFALAGLVSAAVSEFSKGKAMEVDSDSNAFLSGIDLYSTSSPPTSQPTMTTLEGKETTPSQLLRLSEQALRTFEAAGMTYDLEYLGACILQVLCGLYGGSAVGGGRRGGLDSVVFVNIGKMVNIARLMGLDTDPDEFSGTYTLWEKEIRRRIWWDVYYYDLFISDCMGKHPLIADSSFSTKMPKDVDENLFNPMSNVLPIPRIVKNSDGRSQNGLQYFQLKCRLAQLVKSVKRRTSGEDQPFSIEQAVVSEAEVHRWLRDLPTAYHLSMETSNHSSSSSTSPLTAPSSILVAQQCEMAITAHRMIFNIYLPFLKVGVPGSAPLHQASLGNVNAAHAIIHAGRVLWKSRGRAKGKDKKKATVMPAMFRFYSFGRFMFDAAVVCADAVFRQPTTMWAPTALDDVTSALEVMKDRLVFVSQGAIVVVETMKKKAEKARCCEHVAGHKRKFGEIEQTPEPDTDDEKVIEDLELPYVGPGVSSTTRSSTSQEVQQLPMSTSPMSSTPIASESRPRHAPTSLAPRSGPDGPTTGRRETKHAKNTHPPSLGIRCRPPKETPPSSKQLNSSLRSQRTGTRPEAQSRPLAPPPLRIDLSQTQVESSASDNMTYPHVGSHESAMHPPRTPSSPSSAHSAGTLQSRPQQISINPEYSMPFGGSDNNRMDANILRGRRFSHHEVGHTQHQAYGPTPPPSYGQYGNASSPFMQSSPHSDPGSSDASSPFESGGHAPLPAAMSAPMYGSSSGLSVQPTAQPAPPSFGRPVSSSPQSYYAPTGYDPSPSYDAVIGPGIGPAGGMGSAMHYDNKAMQQMYDKSAEVAMQQPFGDGHDMGQSSQMMVPSQSWPQNAGNVQNNGEYWNQNGVQYYQ